jgi:hypothetical protein
VPIRPHTCITVACDVCGYVYHQDEYTTHFANIDEARTHIHREGWLITADRRVYCASEDDAHQAAHDALMPPEPTTVPDGQLTTPVAEGAA